jgi:sensor histidine kinase YesM
MPVPFLEPLINSRSRFWLTQLLFWSLFLVAELLSQLSYIYHEYHSPAISIIIFNAFLGLVFSTPLRYLYRNFNDKNPWKIITLIFIYCLLMATFWTLAKNSFFAVIEPKQWQDVHYSVYFIGLVNALFILLCWTGAYFVLKLYQEDLKNKQKLILLKAEAQEAKLQMLRYQLNPHFLFNTINSISCLIKDQSNAVADEMLTKLSDLLRFTLDSSPIDMVVIDEEIALINRYLGIEKLRFTERLSVKIDRDEHSHRCLVPSLLLQPLVENAIKHALAKNNQHCAITINVMIIKNRLNIEVTNTGNTASKKIHFGVGLTNLQSRLTSIYSDDCQLSFNQQGNSAENSINNKSFTVNINLPVHYAG